MRARDYVFSFACCALLAQPEGSHAQSSHRGPTDASLLIDDAETMLRLERAGFGFADVLGVEQRRALEAAVAQDMAEISAGLPPNSPKRRFKAEWLKRGRFELVALVNRFDRRVFDPPEASTCGEARLIYRLALQNEGRPATRLPMTVNVRFPQPSEGDCRKIAARWRAGPDALRLVRALPPPSKVEINFQSVHVPSFRTDMDDNAEYVQRTFAIRDDGLRPEPLFNTPRPDLDESERAALADWVEKSWRAIDEGTAVVPERFLAVRSISISPRGLAHEKNRSFSELVRAPLAARFANLPLASARMVKTPELLWRRIDELTCAGCHQSRGIAGFHLLGEERTAASFNALAVGHSPHLRAELGWRSRMLEAAARGAGEPSARPFAIREPGEGGYGATCGLGAGLGSWTCASPLVCRDVHGTDVGLCAPPSGTRPGEPCELVTTTASARPEGALVTSRGADATCPAPSGAQRTGAFCAPNWLGFTGGMCSVRCKTIGEVADGSICVAIPSAGYEADCFRSREPVESCLERHYVVARAAGCDAAHPCRADYACARVPGAPPGTGACFPPYFAFQLRVDGPIYDR